MRILRYLPLLVAIPLPAQTPQQAPLQTPPPPPSATREEGPLDSHKQAGVRGVGHPVVVRVQLRGAVAPGAHVVVTDDQVKAAGTCDTNPSGLCTVALDLGDYTFAASDKAHPERVSIHQHVDASTKLVVIELGTKP